MTVKWADMTFPPINLYNAPIQGRYHMGDKGKSGNSGAPTGLRDCRGNVIFVGDIVQLPVTGNVEFHGKWCLYRVEQRGLTPVLSYLRSEKGQKLPEGYTGSPLCDHYDPKMFMFATNLADVRPDEDLKVVRDTE